MDPITIVLGGAALIAFLALSGKKSTSTASLSAEVKADLSRLKTENPKGHAAVVALLGAPQDQNALKSFAAQLGLAQPPFSALSLHLANLSNFAPVQVTGKSGLSWTVQKAGLQGNTSVMDVLHNGQFVIRYTQEGSDKRDRSLVKTYGASPTLTEQAKADFLG